MKEQSQWTHLGEFFADYWKAYGGKKALFRSPYFHLSFVLTAATFGLWSRPGWWDDVLSLVPSVLGFTIGGFAILLSLTSGEGVYSKIVAKARKFDESPLEAPFAKLTAAFFHFIFVQSLSLATALILKGCYATPAPEIFSFLESKVVTMSFWFVGFWLMTYSLTCAIATGEWLFRNSIHQITLLKKLQKNGKAATPSAPLALTRPSGDSSPDDDASPD